MGIAMIGYGISAIWLNLFLATRPWPFVGLLLAAAGMQVALLIRQGDDLMRVTAVFTVTGWFLAIGGLALYLLWLRRHLLGSLS
jgi:hypothetical protein